MGLFHSLKSIFSSKKEESGLVRSFSKALQADPADYERYDYNEADTYRSNRVNPSAEILDFLALYQVNPHVYACVNAIATAIASVDFQILKKGVNVDPDHEVFQKLQKPNPHQVWFELQETTASYLELCGNAFWEEVRDDKYNLLALYPLRPDKMRIIPHPKIKVAGYIYCPRPGIEILYGRDEITHFKYFSSTDEYWGVSPAYAAQNSIILDVYATAYNKKFFQQSAIPEGVLETAGQISDASYQRLRQDWARRHRGIDKSFEIAILEEGLTYKPLTMNHRDMQMAQLKQTVKEEILSAYKVPGMMIGASVKSNAGSLREEKKMFWMDNIMPKLKRLQQIINAEIIPKGQQLELKFVTENIASLIEDIQISTSVAMQLVTHGIMTINEVRHKLFNMDDADWGKTPWIPVGLAQFDSGVHPDSPNAPHITGQVTPEGEGARMTTPAPQGPPNAAKAGNQATPMGGSMPSAGPGSGEGVSAEKRFKDFEKIIKAEPDWTDKKQVRDWRRWNIWKGIVTPDYIEIRNLMKAFFANQFTRVTKGLKAKWKVDPEKAKLKKARAIVITEEAWMNSYTVIKAAADPNIDQYLFNVKQESGKLKADLIPKAVKTINKYGNTTLGEIGVDESFDLANERVVKFLKEQAGSQIDGITEKTRSLMGRELSNAYANGEDFDEMMIRLQDIWKGDLSESRARAIARTEVVTLTQFAALEGARQSGVVKKKRWVSELLDTTRDDPKGEDHRTLHDMTVDIDDVFPAPARGGEVNLMDAPGDPNADPENLVNCLCILDFPGSTEEFEDIEGDLTDEEST